MPKVKPHRCSFREETDDMIAKLKSGDLPGPTG